MNVEVKLYGVLRRYRPADQPGAPHHAFTLVCQPGETVHSVMIQLGLEEGVVAAAAINNQNISLDTLLQPDDKLALFPPSAGGHPLTFEPVDGCP